MKLKRRRAVQVPPRIKSFIDGVVAAPLEKIQEPLKSFVWEFEKGDFHHWLDLFNHFDMYFEKYIKPRNDLQLEDDFMEHDPPFPREAVLQILRVVRIILENCTNKHGYSSYEHHLSSLLASTDVDVVEACLQTLTAFLKSVGKHVIKDASLRSKLFAFAQGWGGKEEGLGLVACAIENGSDPITHELGNTLHFEFYVDNGNQGLQIIHLPEVNTCQQSDLELMKQLVKEYKVPANFRFSLLTRLRFARAFGSYSARLQYTCIRLHAFMFLVQACGGKTDDSVAFFNAEPEFINELVTLLSYEDVVPERVRILCLLSLVAACQDDKTAVLTAVTSGAQRGILSSLAQKAIDAVASKSSEWPVSFAEALISLVTVLVSSSAGCTAMSEAGFIPTLLPLLKDTDPQHLHLVSSAVHVLEAFMDYSNPAAVLFRDLGGLDDTILRLKIEVSHVENGTSCDALVSHHRRSLMKALLRAISLGAYGPGTGSHVYGSEGSLLPYCLCVIFKKAQDFKGSVFSLAANLMSDLIQQDPTCYPILETAGIPSAFLDSIKDGLICSAEAITCIPQCLDALCLNNSGLQAVRDRKALSCLVNIFTNKTYVRVLRDSACSLSSGLDELLRHSSSLRGHVMDVLIEILKAIEKLGHGTEVAAVPMETDAENEDYGKLPESSVDTSSLNVDSFLPDCVNNAACLLEKILQSSDTCRVFIEKKGLEAVLQLFTLPLTPSSVSVGQSLAIAFKGFSSQHSASLARALCSFMREHVKSTNELLISLQGTQLVNVEDVKRTKVLRCLSSLEGILSLSVSLTKVNSNLVSELGASDADVLKDLGATFREILWQQSLYSDPKINEEQSVEPLPENVKATAAEAGEFDDVAIPGLRYMNSVPARNGEVFSQRSRNRLARSRGGRTGRHLEALHIDSDFLLDNFETTSQDLKSKSLEFLVMENLNKLASTLCSFFTSLLKGFTSTNHRRGETGSLSSASKSIGTALAKVFFEALGFSGYTSHAGIDTSLTLKCRYLGKVVDRMGGLIFDSRRSTFHTVMINNLYVQGTFKELLNTFEATSQLLWTFSGVDHDKGEGSKLSHSSWLLKTLESYCHVLEYFVNSSYLLSPASTSQAHLVLQPAEVSLSIGLFPVPTEPKVFVRMLQSQVLDIILPVWNHPMFPSCNEGFVTRIVTLLNYVCCGASDAQLSHGGGSGGTANQRVSAARVPNETTIAIIVEMGFTRRRAEEALRNIGRNSVEMATEWLFTHPEDHVEEDDDDDDDDEMAEALALSLGSSSETQKVDDTKKSKNAETGNVEKALHIDDILSGITKLVQSNDAIAFPLTDILITLCNRDKGEDRKKVISYLIQQLKLCPLETISHTLALLLNEDVTTREIAADNGIVSVAIDILVDFNLRTKSGNEMPIPKRISALLLILDSLLQSTPKRISDSIEETNKGSLSLPPQEVAGKISEKSTGYLTIEEGKRVLNIISDMIRQNVPGMVMQAVLLLCARLTKTHTLALHFLEIGGMDALFSISEISFFLVYETVTSAIIRHLIEDPQTLQTAMELEIRQTVSATHSAGRILPQKFLTSMAPLISRDPAIFMKAVTAVCQLESSGGSTYVVLSKEKEKEKDKSKVSGVEIGLPENKVKFQKKIPTNLSLVIHHMLDIIIKNPSLNLDEECTTSANAMEVDEPSTSKGKSKVDETGKESDNLQERSVRTAKVTFVLKLLSDILLMYVHAAGIVLKRDLEMCHYPGSNGIIHHIVHQFLYPRDESRAKLSEKASWFLVVLCGRSSEGRRRVINELGKVLFSFSSSASNSSQGNLLPDKKVAAFVDLVYSILSKNSSSGNITGSSDVAKGMIDGGLIPCLSSILQVLDLDHPDASNVVNIILKVLESLTRAAIASEQLSLSDSAKKKKAESSGTAEPNQNSQHEVTGTEGTHQQSSQEESDSHSNLNQPAVQEMGVDMDETETVGFMHGEMEDSGGLHNSDQVEMAFHVDDRGGDNTGDEDDDMGDDEDDNDEDGDEEDEDIAEDGPALMSLADTDVEDHDETGLRDEYDDDMVDEEDDDYHENRVIEVRWESVDRLDHIQAHGQLRIDRGLTGMAAEPPERVNAHNFFGVGRPLGSGRRRQQNGTSIETSGAEGNGLQHPLLSRSLGDNSGVPPTPLGDNSVGMESVYTSGRRGLGDSRWTDDGQPQARGQAAAIAQVVEEQFLSQLRTAAQSSSPIIQSNNSASLESQSDAPVADAPVADNTQLTAGLDSSSQQSEDHHVEIDQNAMQLEPNQIVEGDINPQQVHSSEAVEQTGEDLQAHGTSSDLVPSSTSQDNMETGEGDGNVNEQEMPSDMLSASANVTGDHQLVMEGDNEPNSGDFNAPVRAADVDMNVADSEGNENADPLQSSEQNTQVAHDNSQIALSDETGAAGVVPNENAIDPTFLEALPEDLRAEVLASQQAQSTPAPSVSSAVAEDIDPEFLAALPPDIQAEVLAQQRAQRVVQQAEGQPVDMDNASIIATFPAELRHEVLLTSSESVLSALPSSLLAEAQMLRDRAMSHYHAPSLVGSNPRIFNRRTGSGFDRQTIIAESLKGMEVDGEPLLDADGLKGLVRLLRLAQPLAKGLLQRLFLNLSAHGSTRAIIVYLLLNMIKPETEGPVGRLTKINSQRLYGCQFNVVYGRSQLIDGLPPQVLRQILEILTYLATNHSCVADILFYFNSTRDLESLNTKSYDMNDKGKEKFLEGEEIPQPVGLSMECHVPMLLFTKLLNHRNIAHLEQVLGLLHVVVYNAASKLDCDSPTEPAVTNSEDLPSSEAAGHPNEDSSVGGTESGSFNKNINNGVSTSTDQKSVMMNDIFLKLPQADLRNLCSLLGHEGLSDKVYTLTGELLKKLASIAPSHRKFFIVELSDLARSLCGKAVQELITLRNTQMLGLSTGSRAGSSVLRILQTLNSLTLVDDNKSKGVEIDGNQEHVTMWKLHVSLEPLWQELSECICVTESQLGQGSLSSVAVNENAGDPPLPLGTQKLLPFIEAFLVLCDKLQESLLQQDNACATASKIKLSTTSSSHNQTTEGTVTFTRFAEKHRRLLNAFVRQDPGLLEKSLSMLLKAPKLMDFDNKRSYFRSRIRKQHEQLFAGPLRVTVRRAYVLEDSYNQLRMRSIQDMKGRLNVHFRGEEGIDAGGLTREWYQLLSRVIFDKGALLFTTGGNNATFQPNPNSVYQTEHLSYFKFVGRVVAKALFDGQLLDVYFTRSFYKHILGVKVTYHDIEAVDPDYYKNLKWMLENDVSDIPDLTFSMDADEEKHILYEKTEVTDYELKPGGGNIRVTEETKHEYVDLVADHKLTSAIRPQINSFLEGFSELIPRELISMFNDKELELLISGLPEINLNDLQANTEYSGYTASSNAVTWFWEVVKAFNKEDRARLLQFVTGTSKVPLEGFKALQGISGPQRFQIHKAYGAPERLPSAHTCFNQLDLPEYKSKEQLQERLLLAIHEGSEGFGFG